ncbi:hypothetical protein OF83DRAFT_1089205 [Amylostereum chailletii]|nr:hypothetical protein OF83DRAFT_1089205 [Amylostereum chailletii]
MDVKYAIEALLLLGALALAAYKLALVDAENAPDLWLPIGMPSSSHAPSTQLALVIAATLLYVLWIHFSSSKLPEIRSNPDHSSHSRRTSSPRPTLDSREPKRGSSHFLPNSRSRFGYVYMTVPKNYRDSSDDGIVSGLVLGPLISSALCYNALTSSSLPSWYIEPPLQLNNGGHPYPPLQSLVLSRRAAVNLGTLCSCILLTHVCASHYFEARYRRTHRAADGERGSVPRSEMRKWWLYILFTLVVSACLLGARFLFAEARIGIWQYLSYWEIACSATFFQLSLYIAVRLAHRGVTLGELAIIVFGATSLYVEMVNLTRARMWPVTTAYIKTYRLPTPLLIFQLALIPGSLLTGFLLSPLLALSRHIARRPARRLRFPQENKAQRRWMAGGFYFGTLLVVGGLIGTWARWCLGNRDPWLWMVYWLIEGRTTWARPALLGYWAALGSISVAGWNRQLARSRRIRPRGATNGDGLLQEAPPPQASEPGSPVLVNGVSGSGGAGGGGGGGSGGSGSGSAPSTGGMGINFPTVTMPQLPTFPNSEWLDRADRRVPTLGLNARRKYFHGLAVVMFVPGVAVDAAFTHVAFSAAFALFAFAEYVRYFALYPLGAAVHVFMSEFLDHKDGGTAILSHFYLLTGCAGSVWFEASLPLLQYTGILAVGVGDAVASVVGKRVGRHKWSPTTTKTVEGSAAFTASVVGFAWLLRVCGLVDAFSVVRYATIAGVCSGLEGMSGQNDNVVLPVYMWSLLALEL